MVCRIVESFGEGSGRDGAGRLVAVHGRLDGWESIGYSLVRERLAAGDGRGTVFRFGTSGLVSIEPLLEEFDGGGEVVAEFDEQIDVVEVSATAEAVGEVVTRIDGGAQFAAARAEEAEVAFEVFGRGRGVAEVSDGDVHGEMVAEAA